ncbi:hypothetical protein GCM10009662_30710 [Catellatospora coxensis]|uniref:Uncharacterized protein n=1 Tax=Catellatospora coxensis TaxID=310354 RepID=A0A8J3KLH1_9ACTN|nr:hypothetical protein Cco03nite_18570 [Catellatospora coxensis]
MVTPATANEAARASNSFRLIFMVSPWFPVRAGKGRAAALAREVLTACRTAAEGVVADVAAPVPPMPLDGRVA